MSNIEQLIAEIEAYIDTCKPQPFSNSKIIVDKAQIEELLVELRHRTPDEIKKYQKVLTNKESILSDAKIKAETMLKNASIQIEAMLSSAKEESDKMLSEAREQTAELIDQHEIMQRAYVKANQIIEEASATAQSIVDRAVEEANAVRSGAISYTDEMLNSLQLIISHTIENTQSKFDGFMSSLQSNYDIIIENRKELAPSEVKKEEVPSEEQVEPEMEEQVEEQVEEVQQVEEEPELKLN